MTCSLRLGGFEIWVLSLVKLKFKFKRYFGKDRGSSEIDKEKTSRQCSFFLEKWQIQKRVVTLDMSNCRKK